MGDLRSQITRNLIELRPNNEYLDIGAALTLAAPMSSYLFARIIALPVGFLPEVNRV